MLNLYLKAFALFSLLPIFLFAETASLQLENVLDPHITYIDIHKGMIQISNGTRWVIECDSCNINEMGWRVGDHVAFNIDSRGFHGHYVNFIRMSNVPLHDKSWLGGKGTPVKLLPESTEHLPLLSLVEEKGHTLTLSDGTQWHVGWWSALNSDNWKVGERILISKKIGPQIGGSASHVLIDIDQNYPQKEPELFGDMVNDLVGDTINATLIKK